MSIEQHINDLSKKYTVVGRIDLENWYQFDYEQACQWLSNSLATFKKVFFDSNERIVITYTSDQYYENQIGLILKNLQIKLNEVDITSCFILLVSTNKDLIQQLDELQSINKDSNKMDYMICDGDFKKHQLDAHPYSKKEEYQYGSLNPIKIKLHELTDRENFLLTTSKVFCMYPWIHLHAYPTGEAYPCCHAEMAYPVGSTKFKTLKEIYYDSPLQGLREDMLNERPNPACGRCYEQEESGFFSGRRSANKHHGHHIKRIDDGEFRMSYWDIRFSNLCNLSCRSCGHIFSSSWYQDQAKLAGGRWAEENRALNYAGRTATDMWEQLIPHLDYVEQIYFAGGEPLMMAEHYNILDELERRGRFDVRLIYNTNFTHVKLKDRTVFDYWKKFKSVAVGASLDDQHGRAEYIRKGTEWHKVIANRAEMIRVCPNVDFYISPTLSIMNALSLPDFHRQWTETGLIQPQDLNVNILQDPAHFRIDIAPQSYKEKISAKYQEHLEWLRPLDPLQRATVGFESALNFMNATDNTQLIDQFWRKTHELDQLRNENILDVIPELRALQ
jgi:organic radical activating enzyme